MPTPDITPNNDYRTIKVGDKGDDVKLMQRRLAELGYYTGNVDGVFGNQTRRSVERFQYYQGLSVDGIAGKRTLTVLYESKEVVFAPVDVTPTPTQTPKATVGLTTAITPSPSAYTPAPTFVPTPVPNQTASATVVTTSTPSSALATTTSADLEATVQANGATLSPTEGATPVLMDQQVFVLAGATEPLTRLVEDALPTAETPETLHPLMVTDQIYVPFLEILRSTGNVLIPGTGTDQQEVAFSLLSDIYQITYVLDNEGNITNLTVLKNETPQILSLRDAVMMDGILYLPLTVTQELTGVSYTLDEATGRYTVTLPGTENQNPPPSPTSAT